MRDPDRIKPFCDRLARAWAKVPDMRFGQFVCNLYGECLKDPFFIEDDDSIKLVEEYAEKVSPFYGVKADEEYLGV